jgi:hypothetical protein
MSEMRKLRCRVGRLGECSQRAIVTGAALCTFRREGRIPLKNSSTGRSRQILRNGFLGFCWNFWAHFDERRTAFYFLKICKRSKEFFNTIGGEWSFAAVRVEDCFSGLGDRQSAIVIHSVLPGWAEPSPLDRKSPVTEATINYVRVGISRSGMSEVVSFMKSKMV